MKIKTTKITLLFFLTLTLLLPSHSYTRQEEEEEEKSPEEELFNCFVKCSGRRQNEEREITECEQTCVDHYKESKREEEEHGGGGRRTVEPRKVYEQCKSACDERSKGTRQQYECRRMCKHHFEGTKENHHQPEQEYKQCQSRCATKPQGEQRQYCQQQCQWQYEEQKREQKEHEHHGEEGYITNTRERWEEEEEEEATSKNPYFFESQRFDSKYKTQEGHIKVLERFNKRSELLEGIENYRLAVLEANPNTFVIPHHCDAESIFVVVGGKGTISYIWQKQRQSFNLKQGHVIRVPAGSIVYLINSDNSERLYVLKLLQPVNTPGRFKEYFGVGGENPESFYRTFSNEILEAAFNTPREKLEKIFGQQQKGVIIKASKEQIRALSQQSESSKGRREERWGPIDLLKEQPLLSSRYGQYFEASPNKHEQLQDLDIAVSYMNITKGGMVAPHYNSRSTKLVFVVGGNGRFEMACPHLAAQSEQGSRRWKEKRGEIKTDVHYQRVDARLSVGDAFIIPAGHPIAIIASQDSNLQLASFGIKGSNNYKYFLAGKDNVWEQVQSEAKELSFQMPAREIDEIFRSQKESFFVAGPKERKRQYSLPSILDFVGF